MQDKRQKGQGVRVDYDSPKYRKGSRWYVGGNRHLEKRGIAHALVEIVNTYKTFSYTGYTNRTFHVKVLSGKKTGKEYRLSNINLYTEEELT